jgi:hypothetical protein
MKTSTHERQDATYEAWLLTSGPDKLSAEHVLRAQASIYRVLQPANWKILTKETIKSFMEDVKVLEIVIRSLDNNQVKLLRWNIHNNGWMEKLDGGGWSVFRI